MVHVEANYPLPVKICWSGELLKIGLKYPLSHKIIVTKYIKQRTCYIPNNCTGTMHLFQG